MLSYVTIYISLLGIVSVLSMLHYSFAFNPRSSSYDISSDVWESVPCNEYFKPDHCFDPKRQAITLDEFDRCGPAYMPIAGRNYFLQRAGRGESFRDNKIAIRKIKMLPKALRDLTKNSTKVTVLGMEIDYPIGISPMAFQRLANPEGELGMVEGLYNYKTILSISTYATTPIEEIAEKAKGSSLHLFMQIYLFKNRQISADIALRAEKSGFKALVLTADTNLLAKGKCGDRAKLSEQLPEGTKLNAPIDVEANLANDGTFEDITFLKQISKLPIIVKGILTASDAISAIEAGASAIWVSNHGGRQLDYDPAPIDALPFVVDAVQQNYPHIEVYVDGGFRDGYDVFKGLARGAKAVFVGRPFIWGLGYNGSSGVNQVMDIVTNDFKEVMLVSGRTSVNQITRNSLLPPYPIFY